MLNRQRRLRALIIAVVVLLAGCTIAQTRDLDLSAEARLYQAQGEFNILMEAAINYARRPRCTATLVLACSDAQVVGEALRAAERIDTALDTARAADIPTLGLVTVAMAEMNAILVRALQ